MSGLAFGNRWSMGEDFAEIRIRFLVFCRDTALCQPVPPSEATRVGASLVKKKSYETYAQRMFHTHQLTMRMAYAWRMFRNMDV
jgi:hypothetical protein